MDHSACGSTNAVKRKDQGQKEVLKRKNNRKYEDNTELWFSGNFEVTFGVCNSVAGEKCGNVRLGQIGQ